MIVKKYFANIPTHFGSSLYMYIKTMINYQLPMINGWRKNSYNLYIL